MDERFSRLATDPRFRRPKQKQLKVEIDDRFADVLSGTGDFGDSLKKGKKIDKFGRPLTNSHKADQLKHFYRLKSQSPEREEEDDAATKEGGAEKGAGGFVDYARGEGILESSGDEDGSDEEEEAGSSDDDDQEVLIEDMDKRRRKGIPGMDLSDSEDEDSEEGDDEDEDDDGDHLRIDLDEDSDAEIKTDSKPSKKKTKSKPRSVFVDEEELAAQEAARLAEEEASLIDPTKRIAIVNLDWDHMRAIDLYTVFTSILATAKDPAFIRKQKALAARAKASAGESSSSKSSKTDEDGLLPMGELISVRIYPSEFGKERMAKEEQEGPASEVFGGLKKKKIDNDRSGKGKGKEAVLVGGRIDQRRAKRGRQQKRRAETESDFETEKSDDFDEEDLEEDEQEAADLENLEQGIDDEEEEDEEDRDSLDGQLSDEDGFESDDSDLNGGAEVNMDKLRTYQLERLRYYYAVATFSTTSAASYVFRECNGTEFERTANVFDLSYVPDDMELDEDYEDEATEDDKGYKGNDFVTDALRHSKVTLTWDQDDPNRTKLLRRPLTKQEIEEQDFKAYLASSSDEESEGESGSKKSTKKEIKDRTERLRALLLGGGDDVEDVWGSKRPPPDLNSDEEGGGGEMEITFTPGLSKTSFDNDDADKDLTTLEKYQRRMKEKLARKKEKKELKYKMKEDQPAEAEDDFFGGEEDEEEVAPLAKSVGKSKKDAPLPIPVDDAKHFSLQDIIKAEKESGKKKRKRTRKSKYADEREVELGDEGFKVDVADPRFKAIHDEPAFAIDPSNPAFVKTKGMTDLLQERNRRRQETGDKVRAPIRPNNSSVDESAALKELAESVKRKLGNGEDGEKTGGGKKRRRRH